MMGIIGMQVAPEETVLNDTYTEQSDQTWTTEYTYNVNAMYSEYIPLYVAMTPSSSANNANIGSRILIDGTERCAIVKNDFIATTYEKSEIYQLSRGSHTIEFQWKNDFLITTDHEWLTSIGEV